jgi:hypothetical protein
MGMFSYLFHCMGAGDTCKKVQKPRLLPHEPEFVFRYLDLKPCTAAIHTVLPDPDTGETEEFFYQEQSLILPSSYPVSKIPSFSPAGTPGLLSSYTIGRTWFSRWVERRIHEIVPPPFLREFSRRVKKTRGRSGSANISSVPTSARMDGQMVTGNPSVRADQTAPA